MVRFPLLSMEWNISPVAFTVFGIPIYWYAILIGLAMVIFLIFSSKTCRTFSISYEDIIDLCIITIPIAFLGARLYYVAFEWEYYARNLGEIFNVRDGGLAIYGGILAGAITCYFFCKKRKISLGNITDLIVPYLALGQALGRWGNFFNQEAYGMATNVPWRMEIEVGGMMQGVHPTFLYESLWTLGIFLFLMSKVKSRKYEGQLTYWYLILYSFGRFWIEGLRIDSLLFFGLRISQILSLLLFVIFCYIMQKQERKQKKITKEEEKSQTL